MIIQLKNYFLPERKNTAFVDQLKIKNKINDLHWQVINYLTKNYENILIGDMSAKNIIRKKGNLNKGVKKLVSSLSFYKFKLKLISQICQ